MVIPVGHLKSGNYAAVYNDVFTVVQTCIASPVKTVPVKVIIETALLKNEEFVAACFLAAEAGATFVKTCSGFSGGKATFGDVRLMKEAIAYKDGKVQIKASAGIRTYEDALSMVRAGANRIGTSAGVEILEEAMKLSSERMPRTTEAVPEIPATGTGNKDGGY